MTPYRPGTVVLISIPYTENPLDFDPGVSSASKLSHSTTKDDAQNKTEKKRPAMVVSTVEHNAKFPDLILMAITSSIHDPLEEGEILIRGAEINSAGLHKESIVKTRHIFTVDRRKVIKIMGALTNSMFEKAMAGACKFLAIPNHWLTLPAAKK